MAQGNGKLPPRREYIVPPRPAKQADGSTKRRLAALILAVNRINTLRPLDELLLFIAQEGAAALEAQRCTVWVIDQERRELYSRVAMGLGNQQLRMPMYSGLAGDALRRGQITNVPNAAADPRFAGQLGQSDEFHTRSLLSVPMANREGRPVGVFQVLNKARNQAFTTADEQLAQAFASAATIAVQNAQEFEAVRRHRDQLDTENARLKLSLTESFDPAEAIGNSPAMVKVFETARRVSNTDVSVLITGESGTGKSLLAKCIHFHSERRNRPLADINCAAIPETLLEAELFGIEKGIATGVDQRIGKLEAAAGGTIFLDEIADMSLATQAKILRVVQEKAFERVGSQQTRQADVRIISATNKDLATAIAAGRFREDLYYRLAVVTLPLPPLRERREDIPPLAHFILDRLCRKFNRSALRFSDAALERLVAYSWPGNVRELENEIARSLVLAIDQPELDLADLSEKLQQTAGVSNECRNLLTVGRLSEKVEALERRLIVEARAITAGNKSAMARMLGLSREGLRKKLSRYKME
jgi:Nif-specific regulatory protein